jgi:hypothetical protein
MDRKFEMSWNLFLQNSGAGQVHLQQPYHGVGAETAVAPVKRSLC